MRLLFVSNLLPPLHIGGYELNCADVGAAMRAAGHEVSVLTSAHRAAEAPAEPGVFRSLHLMAPWLLPDPAAASGVGAGRLRTLCRNSSVAARTVSEGAFDAAVFWNGANLGRGVLAQVCRRLPTVLVLEDTWLADFLAGCDRSRGLAYREALTGLLGVPAVPRHPGPLLYCSEALRQEYAALCGGETGGRVVPLGIDAALFPAAGPRRRNQGDGPRLLYSGRLMQSKGLDTLVEALRLLRERPGLAGARLTLAGAFQDRAYEAALQRRIGAGGLREAVTLLDQRPRDRLAALMTEHDAVIFPTQHVEPFGLALVEAMAAAMPVVASRIGGPAEIVEDGRTGLFFPAGDAAALAAAVERVISDSEAARAMGQAAARAARERYTVQVQAAAIEAEVRGRLGSG